jgi:Golgi phosphoprotein 3
MVETMTDVKYLTLADEIVVLMLDDASGELKPECSAVAPVAIVGGILMELALQGRIDTDLESLFVVDETPVGDELLDSTLEIIKAESAQHPSAWWIDRLSNRPVDFVQLILARLVTAGVLREEQRKFLWVFSRRAYPQVSGLEGREAKARLTSILYSGEVPDPRDTLLLGLARSTEILFAIFSREEMAKLASRIDEVVSLEEMGRSVGLVSAQVREATAALLLACYP